MQLTIKKAKRPAESKNGRKILSVDEYAQMVEKKAYELYEQGGRREGREMEDWLEAERSVNEHFKPSVA